MIVSPYCAALIAACKLSFGPTMMVRRLPSQRSVNVPRDCLRENTAPIVPTITRTIDSNNGRETDLLITITSTSQSHKEHREHKSGKTVCGSGDFCGLQLVALYKHKLVAT